MTVIVTKDAINLREKLSELDKETGIKGEEIMRADTSAEAREALQLDQQLFTDFESTGIDDNATSTAVTINSSGNITTTGTATFGGNVILPDNSYFLFGDTTSGIQGNSSSDFIKFYTANTERLSIDSAGHAIIPNGVTLGTAAGTYNAANTLDDYEEGIWTPLLVPQTGAFTSQTIINYLTDKPRYTKIGNLVMVSVVFTTYELTKGTGSGNVYLGGLPFEVYTSSAATISSAGDFLGDVPSSGSVSYQSDEILLKYRTSSNGEDVNLQVTDLGTTDGSNDMKLTLVYRTQE
jgi:hypothetical protein